jgi:hypothetical protein
MRTLQGRGSALAVALVIVATLLASDPFTEAAGAHTARGHRGQSRASRSSRIRRARPAPPVPAGDVWARLRHCESGGRYDRNSGNGFYGAYQFLPSTWRRLGFRGMPHQATPEVQDAAARKLQTRSGWGQWPVCSRRIGAR